MTYAAETKVPVQQSRNEIERTLIRYGATGVAFGWETGRALIGFQTKDRRIKFVLPLVPPKQANQKQQEQFVRSRWRALLLNIKAKLEAVESGLETFDEAFMTHIVLPNGQTMGEHAIPTLTEAYRTGKVPPLLNFNG
jgi:hypothetical protein